MNKIIGGEGKIKMLYNYISNDGILYQVNKEYDYTKIIEYSNIKNCNCRGIVNKFYIINNSKIPINRAIKIS